MQLLHKLCSLVTKGPLKEVYAKIFARFLISSAEWLKHLGSDLLRS